MKKALFFFMLITTGMQSFSNARHDSIKHELKIAIEDSNKVIRLNEFAWELLYINPDTGIIISTSALELSSQINYVNGKVESLKSIGVFNHFMGNYENAITNYKKAIEVAKAIGDNYGAAIIKGNLASLYGMQGKYPEALSMYFDVLRVLEKLDKKKGIATTLSHIGVLYLEQSNYEESLNYNLKALAIDEEIFNTSGIAIRTSNIANTYYFHAEETYKSGDTVTAEIELYPKCMEYYIRSNELMKEIGNHNGFSVNLGNMSNAYADLAQINKLKNKRLSDSLYNKALFSLSQALEIDERLGDQYGMARQLGSIGAIHTELKNYSESEKYILKAVHMFKEIGVKEDLAESYFNLSYLYEKTSDFNKALENFKLHTDLKDSLFSESKSKDIGKLEAKYEFEKTQDEEIRVKNEQVRIDEQMRERRNLLQYSGIFVFVLLLFAAVFMSGKFKISERMAEGLIFFTFLLFFEFCLVLLDPFLEQWSGGEPMYKLLFNAALAGFIFPLHAFFENTLKKRLLKT